MFYQFVSYIADKLAHPPLNKSFKRFLKSLFVHSGVLNIFNDIKHIVVFFFVKYHKMVPPQNGATRANPVPLSDATAHPLSTRSNKTLKLQAGFC